MIMFRVSCIALTAAVVALEAAGIQSARAQEPVALELTGDYAGTHDPAIAREGNTYYVFATGKAKDGGQFAIRCSSDLKDWKLCGHVFDKIPAWIHESSPGTRDLWAPDVSYFNGRYHLYYAYSLFGKNTSGIALATNETLDSASPKYHWNDEGLVLRSKAQDDFNAIDPNIVLDKKGQPWMSLGSFWSGIKMRRIDLKTGKLSGKDSRTYAIASRKQPEHAEPARPGFYLFVSFDLCCRGLKSTYRTMVGRSKNVAGPYIDRDGVPMMQGGGTQLLVANQRWLGPGGESVLLRREGDILVFHAYDAATGKPALQISSLTWEGGWPHAALSITGESK
jgi:arabinan endo-1,5-alpha-L-arabinosidase